MKAKFKNISSVILSACIGIIFILSAIFKLPTIEQFGWTIVDTTPLNWTLAEWSARCLIVLEFFLGILFLFHLQLKKITLPISFLLTVFFSLYLIAVIYKNGSDGNCGCFGEVLPMTPLESLIKNGVLLVLMAIVYCISFPFTFRYFGLSACMLFVVLMSLCTYFYPPDSIYIYEQEPDINQPIPLSMLYQSPNNKAPEIELRKGKHIITFMSMTCSYCRKAAKKMRIIKDHHPQIPIFMVLNGDSTQMQAFFDDTHFNNVPYMIFNGAEQFVMLNGGAALPSIKWVQDTTLIRETNYIVTDENKILDWLSE